MSRRAEKKWTLPSGVVSPARIYNASVGQQHPLAVRSARCACSELSVPPTEARNSSRSMRRPPSQVPVTWTVSINAAGSTVHGSALSSTKSASLPPKAAELTGVNENTAYCVKGCRH